MLIEVGLEKIWVTWVHFLKFWYYVWLQSNFKTCYLPSCEKTLRLKLLWLSAIVTSPAPFIPTPIG